MSPDADAANVAQLADGSKPANRPKEDQPMRVRVSSPFKVFFDEDALSVSAENQAGPFDILPHHHNFISLLGECELSIRTGLGDTSIKISGGIMHVRANSVVVFLNV